MAMPQPVLDVLGVLLLLFMGSLVVYGAFSLVRDLVEDLTKPATRNSALFTLVVGTVLIIIIAVLMLVLFSIKPTGISH